MQGGNVACLRHYFKILASFVFLATIGLALLLFTSHNKAIQLVKEQYTTQQMLTAQQIAYSIERNIELLLKELETLEGILAANSMNPEEAARTMSSTFEHVNHLYVNDIGLLDSRGILKINITAPQILGVDFSFRNYFKKCMKSSTGAPVYEFITFKGVDAGKRGIIIAKPILSGHEEARGVILFTIKADELVSGFIKKRQGNSSTWIIDPSGTIIVHPDFKSGTVITALSTLDNSFSDFLQTILARKVNASEYIYPEGIKKIATPYPLRIADEKWSVIIEAPEKVVIDLVTSFSKQYIFGSAIVLTILSISSLFLFLLIGRWNQELEATVKDKTAELQQSENKLRELVESINDWIWEVDSEGKYTYASPKVKDILGYEPEDMLGNTPFSFMPPEETEKIKIIFHEKVAGREPFENLENINFHKNGSLVPLETSGTPIFDAEGNLTGYRGVDRDITERKKTEDEKEELITELKEALDEIKTLRGIIPICSFCKQIRDDEGFWKNIEAYIRDHSEAEFSHAICPECYKKHYPET